MSAAAREIAFQFPGQGSQSVGMGRALAEAFPEARAVFEEADDVLGYALTEVCWEGPEEKLTATRFAQPALLTHSTAVARVLVARAIRPGATAGHSLGEFSAHVQAGSLSFADALRIVSERGRAMHEAGLLRPGAMAAIVGLDADQVEGLCEAVRAEGDVLEPANYNNPRQIVVSGSVEAVERVVESADEHGARMAIRLKVSGAFHSPLMEPAVERLEAALDAAEIRRAEIPVIANVDGEPVVEPEAIRDRLVRQLTAPVRWVDCVHTLHDLGARVVYEPGPGHVLTGLLKRIDRDLEGHPVGTPEQVEGIER